MPWEAIDGGATIGTRGPEDGAILRDDEHSGGARITLETDAQHAPFAITCGIYGWMFHTRYLSSLPKATVEFEKMQSQLADILAMIPLASDPQAEMKRRKVADTIGEFVERFP